ncbi:hypothetical protein GBAR_LOCUS6243 [Geodia barretti]|uniref:MARVEL domain-containing protein n=1 Tax=Geodia barretti TaxID=519541 RepID=A0AA35RD24_GEOBA|nr:hypothetical protein GBAR_LOCUS6243 [Geodia barretti]
MTDVVAGVAGKAAMSMFGPHPSITIVTFWQGIVEIALRGVCVVIAFICIIAAAVALDDLDDDDLKRLDEAGGNDQDWEWEDTGKLARSACGFLIFLAIMVMILEGAIIAQRFLNFGIVERFNLIFIIADIVISAVFAFLFFCIAISTAVYGGRFGDWEREFNSLGFPDNILGDSAELNEDMGGVSFFCFAGLLVFAGLIAFMVISFLLKWRNTQVKYAATPGALGGGTE